ncbi:MAG: aldehyde dehydrogenase (NADP(+)) [Planctomycetota bacterium]
MSGAPLRGEHWWDGRGHAGVGEGYAAIEAASGAELAPRYRDASAAEVEAAVAAAAGAAAPFAAAGPELRARFLRAIAARLLGLGDELLDRAGRETALPRARLEGERARTVLQLEQFADRAQEGSWVDARIDRGDPHRTPQPRPDLRAMLVPLGPVAVFGASNFPFAYSVAGGDTASALAVGCPVVVKAHPAHPGTSELTARAIAAAAAECELPAGVFGMVHGRSHEVGAALVQHPDVAAVGFTGSVAGGSALCRLAAARDVPIPVFAEMGSVNPVFVLPGALRARGDRIAAMLSASALLATGQFCTSPGMALVPDDPAAESFLERLGQAIASAAPGTLVHPSIREHFERALGAVRAIDGVVQRAAAAGAPACAATGAGAVLLQATVDTVLEHGRLRDEVYGPALLAVRCRDVDDMLRVARALHGHLTATVHATNDDLAEHRELLQVLRGKVGRLVFDGVPTGVEVATAMQHGGPWPASSDSRFTAVGPRAMLRWARPVCWQDAPAVHLPPELADDNPRDLWRTVDGALGRH